MYRTLNRLENMKTKQNITPCDKSTVGCVRNDTVRYNEI